MKLTPAMTPRQTPLPLLVLALALLTLIPSSSAGVNITTLPRSLVVQALINGQNITSSSQLVYLQDNLTVQWRLNMSFANHVSAYKQIVVQLCFGAPSYQGRSWRAPNQDLSLSMQCLSTNIATQPFPSVSNSTIHGSTAIPVPSNTTTWQAGRSTPGALYFVRVFALNSSSTSASPANNAVAVGQTSNASSTSNLFQVVAYMGTTVTLDITIIVLSVFSYALLFGWFFYERYSKKIQ